MGKTKERHGSESERQWSYERAKISEGESCSRGTGRVSRRPSSGRDSGDGTSGMGHFQGEENQGARRSPAQQDSQDFPTCVERCRGWEDMLHRGLGCIHELGQRQCAYTSVILHVVFKLNACLRSLDTSIPPQMLSTTCEAARTIMLTNERAGDRWSTLSSLAVT